ncbi:phosphatidate cytidylyltransferase [Winogradskyella immobilis]|uniref:Phosphatidate cytidylyltransferase n=1 Tax=Winogradskyella immobilis TaxID=2816852 RepID=A0ABS8EN83_9FLAO|nr:phosphatidate cytidylyltransferase [Winogradskyella immobilis]MCC1484669.1 phosphatidate cytidylyltransferase [Winogradskyella immobilis]MCG0016761.1 phosphatidate cytidylyltransferase [Winogradskyella immobilis]
MKEFATRAISGILYIILLIASMYWQNALLVLLALFGIISLAEFSKLIHLKSFIQYIIFICLYFGFWYWCMKYNSIQGTNEAIQILLVITVFVNLFLIKDLFVETKIPLFESKRYIATTFYLSSSFIFMILIANYLNTFTPLLLLGSFILVWVNDSFAYLVGKNFGNQKLFSSISPKKTVEGFLGGLFFACVSSYFIAEYTETLGFTSWLILAIIISVFGTLGDLIESKFKRQAKVKDSGVIMPGHGGLLDRLDSIIFAAPFIYLFLRILSYVS